jgi:hypothetical protein
MLASNKRIPQNEAKEKGLTPGEFKSFTLRLPGAQG